MKEIVRIGKHNVVRGATLDEYVDLMKRTVPPQIRDSFWDFPYQEMVNGAIIDNGCLYFEIEQGGEMRYFETAVTTLDD